jgi:uncharacterized membrane protein
MKTTRRDAIKQGGALAALLALGGPVAPAAAAKRSALSARRRQVYRSLLSALQGTAGGEFRHRDASVATERFAAWYAAQDDAIRVHADAVLDHLDAMGLRRAGRGRALRDLRGWAGAKSSPDAAEAVHSAAVAAAVALAAQATAPPPDEDDAPVVPLLVGG